MESEQDTAGPLRNTCTEAELYRAEQRQYELNSEAQMRSAALKQEADGRCRPTTLRQGRVTGAAGRTERTDGHADRRHVTGTTFDLATVDPAQVFGQVRRLPEYREHDRFADHRKASEQRATTLAIDAEGG